jgi:hypothetical protein
MSRRPVTARKIIADLEAARVDPLVVGMVAYGLAAIAKSVLELDDLFGLGGHADAVDRDAVLELVDPRRARTAG